MRVFLLIVCLAYRCQSASPAESDGGEGGEGGGGEDPGGGGGGDGGGGGGGHPRIDKTDGSTMVFIIGAVFGFLCIVIGASCEVNEKPVRRVSIPDAQAFLASTRRQSRGPTTAFVFPSGSWRCYYQHHGQNWNAAELAFQTDESQRRLAGEGVDEVGTYQITGTFTEDGSGIAFQKNYQQGSNTVRGGPNHQENYGHCVEYRGQRVGTSLGQGFKGTWYVNVPQSYSASGVFHLWPLTPTWRQEEERARSDCGAAGNRPRSDSYGATGNRPSGMTFTVNDDNPCVVCFDKAIDVCFLPCGHIAVCRICAGRLYPRKCPVCGESVTELVGPDGQPIARQRLSSNPELP